MARKKTKDQKKAAQKRRVHAPTASRQVKSQQQSSVAKSGSTPVYQPISESASKSGQGIKSQPTLRELSDNILGYDYRLIFTDLKVTLAVTLVLILTLIFLSWYLPFGLSW